MERAGGRGEAEKLRRLPPGRHGLSREFVTQNQRERLTAGTIASVAERGYRETTVTHIAAAAGVSRRTFYTYFSTKEECFLATFDLLEEHLFATLEESAEGERGWTAKVRARVAALLAFLAGNPSLVSFALIAPPAAGGSVLERNRRLAERLVESLTEGVPEGRGYSAATAVEREAMAGALAAVLVARVEADGGEGLADASAELVELILIPFVGRRRATAEAKKS